MSSQPTVDLYSVLGVPFYASQDDLQRAYREAAKRFHPDVNKAPSAAQEFKAVTDAFQLLNDATQRQRYDEELANSPLLEPVFRIEQLPSRQALSIMTEPQVVYMLLSVYPSQATAHQKGTPPLNICLVVDRSTSMRERRLDQVKSAARQIIDSLQPQDTFAVVSFSDRAQVVIPATRNINKAMAINRIAAIQAGGGTEILQGLMYGLAEVHRNLNPGAINHVVLLTDGHTYGDEAECYQLATRAELDGITISGLGIGAGWNDEFLDELTGITGGKTTYTSSSKMVTRHLREHVLGLGDTFAERMRLSVVTDPGVELQEAFRLRPTPQPVDVKNQPLRLGSLDRRSQLSVMLRFLVPAQPKRKEQLPLARLRLTGDVISLGRIGEVALSDFIMRLEDIEMRTLTTPPRPIIDALEKINLYQMQLRVSSEAGAGNVEGAIGQLQVLASRLMAQGQQQLAEAALSEVNNLKSRRQLSEEGKKELKYGTRALLLAAPR